MPDDPNANRLTLDIERNGDVAVVRLSGQLVAGVTDFLYTEIGRLLPQTKRLVLDLTDLVHMDSTGLGTLVRVYVSCKSAGCALELVNLGKRIRQLLGMTHLLSVFTIIGESGARLP